MLNSILSQYTSLCCERLAVRLHGLERKVKLISFFCFTRLIGLQVFQRGKKWIWSNELKKINELPKWRHFCACCWWRKTSLTASCYLINNTLIFVIKMTLASVLPGNTASRVDLITVNGERERSLVEKNKKVADCFLWSYFVLIEIPSANYL